MCRVVRLRHYDELVQPKAHICVHTEYIYREEQFIIEEINYPNSTTHERVSVFSSRRLPELQPLKVFRVRTEKIFYERKKTFRKNDRFFFFWVELRLSSTLLHSFSPSAFQVKTTLHWALLDAKNNAPVFCFEVPVKIIT